MGEITDADLSEFGNEEFIDDLCHRKRRMRHDNLRALQIREMARGQQHACLAGGGVLKGGVAMNKGDIGRFRVDQSGGAAHPGLWGSDEGALEKGGDLSCAD